jgi:segregation and condensation protein B
MSQVDPGNAALLGQLVAVLFMAAEGADRAAVQRALDVSRGQLARLLELARETPMPGLLIQEHGDVLRLVTHTDAAEAVRRFIEAPHAIRLSGASLETLAVIAYTQPTTRAQIADARGVNSDGPITTLLQHGLIVEAGHADAPGRPTLFETTPDFLTLLGISSLDDLPTLTPAPE